MAAGGLLERSVEGRTQIAVVHRLRYGGDTTLPKGKLREGESWEQGALREVREETAWEAELVERFDAYGYLADGVPKIVVIFRMRAVREVEAVDPDEVREVRWLSPDEAIAALTYPREQEVVRAAYGNRETRVAPSSRFELWLYKAPYSSRIRLQAALSEWEIDLEQRLQQHPQDVALVAAGELLDRARRYARDDQVDQAWRVLSASRRRRLMSAPTGELSGAAVMLRYEAAAKLTGWRKESAAALLGAGAATNGSETPTPDQMYMAEQIRDEHFENVYQKVYLLRAVLRVLPWVLGAALLLLLAVVWLLDPATDTVLGDADQLALVCVLGAIGGSLSAQILAGQGASGQRVPEVLSTVSAMIGRPLVGAASAVLVVLVLQAGLFDQSSNDVALYAFAVVAGFAERLVTRAVSAVVGE
jgi:8-oxo-dGTP diphosphatase